MDNRPLKTCPISLLGKRASWEETLHTSAEIDVGLGKALFGTLRPSGGVCGY